MKTLITGGIRSGKSRHAEALFAEVERVRYVAPGYRADPAADPEWAERVAAHQHRRPATWETCETTDLAAALATTTCPVLIDCLGTWLTRQLDELDAWNHPRDLWWDQALRRIDDVVTAWTRFAGEAVAVTNEVGWTLVPTEAGSRAFVDLLGRLNAGFGAGSDQVLLVVAGRSITLQ